jgi:hypothetical protein
MALVGVCALSGTAMAAETDHGMFVGGRGVNSGLGQEGYPAGTNALSATGVWAVSIGSNGVQVGGVLRNPACPLAPCGQGWAMNLSGGTPWVEVLPSARPGAREFTSLVDWGVVRLDLHFFYFGPGVALLAIGIEGCPHGWTYWEVDG